MIQDDRPAPPASYQALDLLCTLMTVLDEQGAVLFANAALENALGLSRRMLEGSELAACFTEPALLDKALRGAQDNDFAALRFEASLHRVGGDALPVHVTRSEEHTSELQSQSNLVCRLLLEKKKKEE